MLMRSALRSAIAGAAVGVFLVVGVLGVAYADEHDGSGQVTVDPVHPWSRTQPPKVRIDATYGVRSSDLGERVSGSGDTSAAMSGTSSGSDGGGSGPTCRMERPSGMGFVSRSTTPKEMRRYFPDLYMGSRGGDESKVFIARCSDGSLGWVTGDGAGAGPGGSAVLPSAAELAERARRELVLPLPEPGMSPRVRLRDGRWATLVREPTWVWVDPGVWRERSKRVRVGPVWAEVTASPRSLRFTAMGRVLSCAGAGTPYERSYGVHAASPDCGLRFARSSGGAAISAVYEITWSVSWRGSTGGTREGGELPDMVSRASESVVVAEAQSLRSR